MNIIEVKNPPANVGDTREAGSISGSGRSPEEGNGNSLQYSCLETSVDKGAWRARVHGVSKSWTPLSTHANTHTKWIYLIIFVYLFSAMFYFWYNLFGFHGGSYVYLSCYVFQTYVFCHIYYTYTKYEVFVYKMLCKIDLLYTNTFSP